MSGSVKEDIVDNKYICVNCLQWVDKLYTHIFIEDGEETVILVCQDCLLEENEVIIDSDLLHYSISKDILEEYLKELKGFKSVSNLIDKEYVEKEVFYLEQVILPSIRRRIDKLKDHLI
jgi:hypothetical protein